MLILTRRVGETVMIGNDVTVTVLGVRAIRCELVSMPPKSVAVHREEIFERIKREQQGEPQGETKAGRRVRFGLDLRCRRARISRAMPKRVPQSPHTDPRSGFSGPSREPYGPKEGAHTAPCLPFARMLKYHGRPRCRPGSPGHFQVI